MNQLHEYLKSKTKQRDDLLAKYGTGVRPSWVSTDLSILNAQIYNVKMQINEEQNETTTNGD